MARKKKATKLSSLALPIAAIIIVVAVLALAFYLPGARTGKFHGTEATVGPISIGETDTYDFDSKTLTPSASRQTSTDQPADMELVIGGTVHGISPGDGNAGTNRAAKYLLDNSVTVSTDCSTKTINQNYFQFPGTGTYYFCILTAGNDKDITTTSDNTYALVQYTVSSGMTDTFLWVKQNICGDGFVQTAKGEQCDDGNTVSGDGCSSTCQIEPETNCFDGIDNNNNGQTDCADSACAGKSKTFDASGHGSVTCSNGNYFYMCDNNFDNCDNNVVTGCEADLTTSQHCGACTNVCTASQACQQVSGSYTCVNTADNQAPTVTLTAPTQGTTVSGTITITATASDNVGVAGVQFKVDSSIITTDTTSPYSTTLDTTTLTNGAHTITAIASDAAGNTNSNAVSVTVSNAAGGTTCSGTPVLTLNPTSGTASTSTTATISGLTSCANKVAKLDISSSCANAASASAYCTIGTDGASCTGAAFTPASTQTFYACLDKNTDNTYSTGEISAGATFTVTGGGGGGTDTTPPTISNVQVGSISSSSAAIGWTTNEPATSQVEYGISTAYGSVTTVSDTIIKVTSHAQTLSGLSMGTTYHYRVKSNDAAGNPATSSDSSFLTSSVSAAVCGNSIVETGEDCDPGQSDSATCNGPSAGAAACKTSTCGDGYINIAAGEQCEPQSSTGCTNTCTTTVSAAGATPTPGAACNTPGSTQAYYDGPDGTESVGTCSGGLLFCNTTTKKWDTKIKEVKPNITEDCDGRDDNCNYLTDDAAVNGKVIEGGACNTADKCGLPAKDCRAESKPKFSDATCVPSDNGNNLICGYACQSGYVQCGGSCYKNVYGRCVSDQWLCSAGTIFDSNINQCIIKEGCPVIGATQSCYNGPTGTRSVGACVEGTRTCDSDKFWSTCAGQVWPTEDVCDGIDNNCNGLIDDYQGRGEGSACPGATNCGPSKMDCTQYKNDASLKIDGVACVANKCKILTCALGREDKDGKVENGCEYTTPGCIDPDKDYYGAVGTDLSKCTKKLVPSPTQVPDCDSKNAAINPNATEICNGIDDNCNGLVDENILETQPCGLGICAGGQQTRTCEADNYTAWSDCSTSSKATTETCNTLDDNCNGLVDENWDHDNDTFPGNVSVCVQAYAAAGKPLDCDDNNPRVFPGANETCDGLDNDCNGIIDDIGGSTDPATTGCACSGMTPSEVAAQRKVKEDPTNGIDDNCDGKLDPQETDHDGDGFTPAQGDCDDNNPAVNPDATELCYTKYDDNCNGKVNEGCAGAAVSTAPIKNVSILEQAFGTTPQPATPPAAPSLPPAEVGAASPAPAAAQKGQDIVSDISAGGTTTTEEKKTNTTLIGTIISLVAAALGGSLWFVRSKMKANISAEAESFGVGGPEETEFGDVKDFISSSVSQGAPASTVKETLQQKGWQSGDINKALDETAGDLEQLGKIAEKRGLSPDQEKGITSYIKNARTQGFSDAQIKAALVNGGWDSQTVEKYL